MDSNACSGGARRAKLRLLKAADIIILALACAAVFLSARSQGKSGGALSLEVQGPAAGGRRYRASYPLGEDRTFSVEGREGAIVVEIADGSAFVASAPCKNRLCIASPPISQEGEWTACAPGEVIIRVAGTGTSSQGIDNVAY